MKRLERIERRLSKNKKLADKYREIINGYINEGHARKLTEKESKTTSNITNYIPHPFALNPDKPDKIRVVYDTTAKYRNVSMNDKLLKQPDLLNNLVKILIEFRKGKHAALGDIEKISHQVKVKEGNRDALRFFWRDSPSDEISDYQMLVHLFGKIDSPYCSNYALKRSGLDERETVCQDNIESIQNDFYMDDYLKSSSSPDNLVFIVNAIKDLK